jgi:hypothetical protein
VTVTGTAVSAHGLSVLAPRGWEVRIYRRPAVAPETAHAVLHGATFALPADRGDYGDGAVQLMRASDVFVALVEFHPSATGKALFARQGFPASLTAGDLSPSSLQVALPGQAGVQRWFTAAGRAWCLYVVVGSWASRASLVVRAGELIAGIEVQAG